MIGPSLQYTCYKPDKRLFIHAAPGDKKILIMMNGIF